VINWENMNPLVEKKPEEEPLADSRHVGWKERKKLQLKMHAEIGCGLERAGVSSRGNHQVFG
jgi:hypothetical protein